MNDMTVRIDAVCQVFCVHGGIPMPNLMGKSLISAINDVPSILSNPMEESPLAWDLMWNDPIRLSSITHFTRSYL